MFSPTIDPSLQINHHHLLIVNKTEHHIGHKIAPSLVDARLRLHQSLQHGKHILILPGTYDLLHLGHLVWINQALDYFLARKKLTRSDVLVVTPLDSDLLTRFKKLTRHISCGGSEVYLRPIISEKRRAISLANLPSVDLVVIIPSPLELSAPFISPHLLPSRPQSSRIKSVLKICNQMLSIPNMSRLQDAFLSWGHHPDPVVDNIWSLPAWQLLFFRSLIPDTSLAYRILSLHDNYLSQAKLIMHICGIHTYAIKEYFITSTTGIIEKNNTPSQLEALIASTYPLSQQVEL